MDKEQTPEYVKAFWRDHGIWMIPNRGSPTEGFGLMGQWQLLYPDGTHHKDYPSITCSNLIKYGVEDG